MRIAIVTEKPHMARVISKAAQPLFPHDTLEYLICWPVGIYTPALPRGLHWRDYPYIAPFEVEGFERRKVIGDSPMQAPGVGRPGDDGELVYERSWEAFNASLANADRIISLMDPSPHLYHFDVARRRALGQGVAPGEARMLHSLDAPALHAALTQPSPQQDARAQSLIAYGRVRHYFHHQFAVNSLAILGRLTQGAWVSKYQLQLLYALLNMPPASEGEWIGRMRRWSGTGRYPVDQDSHWPRFASTLSGALIWDQVGKHGWRQALDPDAEGRTPWTISEAGNAFLNRLHPGCKDADLPFRLHTWAQQGLETSQPAIDRYVRTFFGRQKRFMDSQRSMTARP